MRAEQATVPATRGFAQALDTGWQLARARAGSLASPAELNGVAVENWKPATVPGTVADALRTASEWSWSNPESLDSFDWWYRARFAVVPNGGEQLCLDGLATIADVWLNGTHLLHSENMFVAHRVPVAHLLRAQNELVIRFHSLGAALAARRPRPRWKTRLVAQQGLRWFRTTLLGRMPGWSSSPEPVGPWRAITLVGGLRAVAAATRVTSRIVDGDGIVTVHVTGLDPAVDPSGIAVTVAGTSVRLARDDSGHSATLKVAGARRWWPHTHGDQWLYPVAMTWATK